MVKSTPSLMSKLHPTSHIFRLGIRCVSGNSRVWQRPTPGALNIFCVSVFSVITRGRTSRAADWRKVWLGCPTAERCHFDLLVTAAQAGPAPPGFLAAVGITLMISKRHTPSAHHPSRVWWVSATTVMAWPCHSAHSLS